MADSRCWSEFEVSERSFNPKFLCKLAAPLPLFIAFHSDWVMFRGGSALPTYYDWSTADSKVREGVGYSLWVLVHLVITVNVTFKTGTKGKEGQTCENTHDTHLTWFAPCLLATSQLTEVLKNARATVKPRKRIICFGRRWRAQLQNLAQIRCRESLVFYAESKRKLRL